MSRRAEPAALEGEILQQRFAVLQVYSRHGDWVRCRVFDMQAMAQHEAVVQLTEGAIEVELIPADESASQAASQHAPAPPPEPSAASPPEAGASSRAAGRSSRKPGRLEAAWFAAGANAEAVSEEDRPVEDGDIVIAPSKIERAATDITTGTYMRYALDDPSVHPQPSPDPPPAPLSSGLRRLLWPAALVAGLGLLIAIVCVFLWGCDEVPARPDVPRPRGDGPAPRDSAEAGTPREAGEAGTPREAGGGKEGSAPTYSCKSPHPAWLLCEDFEGMSAGFATWLQSSVWTENIGGADAGRMTSSTEAHGGSYSLYMPAAASAGYRGADLIWRACSGANKPGCTPLKGYPRLYFRTYLRLAPDHKKVHHFLSIDGGPLDDYWAPYGNAGCRPNGKSAMGTTVDFKNLSHETFFYTYFPAMKCDPGSTCSNYADPAQICADCAAKGMPCSSGLECCWGNVLTPSPPVALPLDKWVCFEMMMQPNDVGQSNGEMAYWIDGKLGHQVKNMKWRDVSTLQLNMVRLQHYLETEDAAGHSNRIWFDDVVVSTAPVGCM
jgi:hypothetical protein